MERQGGAAGFASRRAPSQGARAPDRKGCPKGLRKPSGALPALHSLIGETEKGKVGVSRATNRASAALAKRNFVPK